jgi:hypothetical protein
VLGQIHGDLRARSVSRLAILPDTTHGTLMAEATLTAATTHAGALINDWFYVAAKIAWLNSRLI